MQRHVWMVGKEAIHELGFVGEGAVSMRWISLSEGCVATTSLGKADKLLAGVAAGSARDDAPLGLEGGI